MKVEVPSNKSNLYIARKKFRIRKLKYLTNTLGMDLFHTPLKRHTYGEV